MSENGCDNCNNGIHPNYGVCAQDAGNTIPDDNLSFAAGCKKLWYNTFCKPRFDAKAANAQLSEFHNWMKCLNPSYVYDCCKLTNARDAYCESMKNTSVNDIECDDYIQTMPTEDDCFRPGK